MSEPQQRAEVTLQGTEFRFHEDQRLVCFVHRSISRAWNSVWRVAGAQGTVVERLSRWVHGSISTSGGERKGGQQGRGVRSKTGEGTQRRTGSRFHSDGHLPAKHSAWGETRRAALELFT